MELNIRPMTPQEKIYAGQMCIRDSRRIWNHRACGFLQPEEPPQRGRTRLGPMGRRIPNRQTVPGQKEPKAKPYPDPAFPDGAGRT